MEQEALSILTNPGYQWFVTPTSFSEFARVPSGAASARRFLDRYPNIQVISGADSQTIAGGKDFRGVFDNARATMNHSGPKVGGVGLGDRPLAGRPHTDFNDIVNSAFATEMQMPLVTAEGKFPKKASNYIARGVPKAKIPIPGVALRIIRLKDIP